MSTLPLRQLTFCAATEMVFPAVKLKSVLPSSSFMCPLISTAPSSGGDAADQRRQSLAPLPFAVPAAAAGCIANSRPTKRHPKNLILTPWFSASRLANPTMETFVSLRRRFEVPTMKVRASHAAPSECEQSLELATAL